MNALNFLTLKQNLGYLIDRDNANDLPFLGQLINEAYLDICKVLRLDTLVRSKYLSVTAPYTTGTVAVSVGGTTVTGTATAFTASMVGQTILLSNQPYEIYSITDGTHLVLARKFEGAAAITADTTAIYYDAYTLPYGWEYVRLKQVLDPLNGQSLHKLSRDRFDSYFPNPVNTGTPVFVCPSGYWTDRYPKTGTVSLAATTSTVQAVLVAGASTIDDYYNDWYLINTARSAVSKITDYTGSTLVALNSPAITAQVATDAAYLEKKLSVVKLYPMPAVAQTYTIKGYELPAKMASDYEVPFAIPEDYHRIIYLRAASHSSLILDDARKKEIDKDYNNALEEMAAEYNIVEGEDFEKEAIDSSNQDQDFLPYKYPLG